MRRVFRSFLRWLAASTLAGAVATAASPPAADASTADLEHNGCAGEAGPGNGECQHFLRNPAGPTDDPCWCDRCRNGGQGRQHDAKVVPFGWNPNLFSGNAMDAYLKRHAVAWGITCSDCVRSDKPWPDAEVGGRGTMPEKDFEGLPAKDRVLVRLEVEKTLFKKPDEVTLAYNRHFYLATDVDGLKVRMPGGSSRAMSRHEWTHLMIERAEFARREWVRNLGEPIVMRGKIQRPIAVYIPERFRDFDAIGAKYFKAAGSLGLHGPVAELCDGMCLTGFSFSKEECRDDHTLTVYLRHQISHALLSMWGSLETRPKAMPVWLDEGLAHWLTKSLERYRDDVFYCLGEGLGGPSAAGGGGPAWPGKEWEKDLVRWAQQGKLRPIEQLLGETVLLQLKEEDHKRAWSWLDVALTDWREPFVKVLAELRQEKPLRESFVKHLACTPEQFDDRWKARILGKRKSVAPTAADADTDAADAPGARDRRSIASEKDPRVLAAKLRQLGEIQDPKTIPFVADVIAQEMDLPRETALVALLGVKQPACREAVWNYGLGHPDGMVRAYTARVCGRLRIDAALPKLEAQLTDRNWYARAEAAVACGEMRHRKALPGLRKIVESDSSDKARVGAMDALAMFGADAGNCVPAIAKMVDAPQWQLRIAAAQALGRIGSMEAVDALIARFEKEPGGRVGEEVRLALSAITRDDLGRKSENWRAWWEKEKARAGGKLPKRPDAPQPKPPAAEGEHVTRDGPAPVFGVELFSNRVAFVCDTSESMKELFTPDAESAKSMSRKYSGSDKLSICKEEVSQALGGLDARSHFNVVTFGTQIRSFKPQPVPGTPGNVDSARGFLRQQLPLGETNYYDALKVALDIGANPDTSPDLRPTPDTITFLTDGQPTKGDITDGDVLLEWYTGLNRYARVRTHTITFGVINVDVPLLQAMAARNGGKFTLIAAAK